MRIRWLLLLLVAGCTSTGAGTLQSTTPQECKPLNAKSAVVRCTPTEVAVGEIVRVEGDCAEVHVKSGAPASGDRVALLSR